VAYDAHPAQGGKSVEVRPVSVTKGMSTQRMVGLMAEVYGIEGVAFDFVLCIGVWVRGDPSWLNWSLLLQRLELNLEGDIFLFFFFANCELSLAL